MTAGDAGSVQRLAERLAAEPAALSRYLHSQLAAADQPHQHAPAGQRWLIVVDQFEELFTLCRSAAEQRAFVDALLAAVDPSNNARVAVVIALRADFYAQCGQHPALRRALAAHQEFIGPMSAEELRRAIEGPTLLGGWEFEPGIVDLILRDAGDEPGTLPLLSHAVVYSVDYSADGTRLATSSWDRRAAVWSAQSGELLVSLPEHPDSIARVAFSPDGASLATAAYDGVVRLWDAASGQSIRSIAAHGPLDIDVAWDAASRRLATGGSDGTVKLWDAATGNLLAELDGHSDRVHRVAFSPDGTSLASASWDGTARIWRADSGEHLATLAADGGQVKSVAFSADGSRLATAHEDGAARIWSLTNLTGMQQPAPTHTLAGHTGSAWDAAFNPAGDLLATLGFDGAVRLWDATTGQELLAIPGENNGADLQFSPDGRFLATTSGSGKMMVYAVHLDDLLALARSRLTRSLTPAECQRYLRVADCPG